MIGQPEIKSQRNISLQLLNGLIVKFFDPTTFYADEMIVVLAPVDFKDGIPTFKMVTLHQPGRFKLGEHPINRGQPDFVTLGDKVLVNLLGTEMAVFLTATLQDFQNLDSRQSDLESRVSNVFGFQRECSDECFRQPYRVLLSA